MLAAFAVVAVLAVVLLLFGCMFIKSKKSSFVDVTGILVTDDGLLVVDLIPGLGSAGIAAGVADDIGAGAIVKERILEVFVVDVVVDSGGGSGGGGSGGGIIVVAGTGIRLAALEA